VTHRAGAVLTVTVVLALILAGCGDATPGDPSTAAPVLPIDDVLDSAIVVTPDPTGTSATLTVTTSIPLACAVIYGIDEAFGAIATDDDMAGGAHQDHAPVLRGLEPETEYRYVLQGSDANGNLYRSGVRHFTTPTATEPERPGPNVASMGAVVAVSSEFSDAFAAAFAIDGDPSTEWSTAGDGDDAWLTIELPAPTDVVGFAVRSRSMGDGSSVIQTYRVTVDDSEVFGPFEARSDGLSIAQVTAAGQRFRFDAVTTTGGNTGAVEIEIHAAP
jgi:hypothetical protein